MDAFFLKSVAIFALVCALDFVWANYTKSVTNNRVVHACFFSAMIYLLGGISTIGYVADPRLLAPAVLGGIVGTVLAMREM